MRRAFIVAALLFAALGSARAQPPFRPCPFVQVGWSQQYSNGQISSVQYDGDDQFLYVVFGGTTASAFANVPWSIMQAFMQTRNPITVYNSFVLRTYHALLLWQTNNCPVIVETAQCVALNGESGPPLLDETTGVPLCNETSTTIQGYLWTD